MKRLPLHSSIVVLIVSCILISCKKEITPSQTNESSSNIAQAALTSNGGNCTPDVFGVYSKITYTNIPDPRWVTLIQKFYNPEGTLTNIKAFIAANHGHYDLAFLDLPWGVVTYHGNQVYVTDGLKNKLVMRVTLNGSGLPEASYYYNDPPAPHLSGVIDTSYYYYTGSRLNQIFSSVTTTNPGSSHATLWNLQYDAYGNVQVLGSNVPGSWRLSFTYDYNKPITGIMKNYHATRPLQLLEYMGLLNLPMLHQPTEIVSGTYSPGSGWPHDILPAIRNSFNDVVYTKGGQVYSYVDGAVAMSYHNTYYTGWNCLLSPSPGLRMSNVIGELQDFQKQFPNK